MFSYQRNKVLFLILIIFWLGPDKISSEETPNNGENDTCYSDGEDCKSTGKSKMQRYTDLKRNLAAIKEACGEVCDTTITGTPGEFFEEIKKEVDCKELFSNPLFDRETEFDVPLIRIPKYLLDDYTYQGRVKLVNEYRDNSNGKDHWLTWDAELMEKHFGLLKNGTLIGSYGKSVVDSILKYATEIIPVKDQHVLVIGSERPWIETILLHAGAKHVTTLDYVPLESRWPTITTITPDVFGQMYLNGTLPKFDAMVTFSSVEHSGLGRYGDALNPWGDLIAMARAWCFMESGTKALVGVPTGPDWLTYNSARLYGPVMYAHLFANWKVVLSENDPSKFSEECNYCYQPLHVLERP